MAATVSLAGAGSPSAQMSEGMFIPVSPPNPPSVAPAIHSLGDLVRIHSGSPPREIVGRLVRIDSAELVLLVDGMRHTLPVSDILRIEAIGKKKPDRAARWLTIAGLAGVLAAFWFGQIGGY